MFIRGPSTTGFSYRPLYESEYLPVGIIRLPLATNLNRRIGHGEARYVVDVFVVLYKWLYIITAMGTGPSQEVTEMAEVTHKVSPALVEKYLAGVHYPASKQELIARAKSNQANRDVIDTLNGLPEKTFNSPIDISKAMSRSATGSTTASASEKRGLAAASEETRERVAHMGGEAPHEERGLQAASQETRERVAHMGGEASVSTKTHVSAAEVQKFLKGMDYPAGKKEVIGRARKNNAPDDVISVLEKIKDQKFNTAADVSKALGHVM
jgi:hypothetical protein